MTAKQRIVPFLLQEGKKYLIEQSGRVLVMTASVRGGPNV